MWPGRRVGPCQTQLGLLVSAGKLWESLEPGEAGDRSSNSPAVGNEVFAKAKEKAGLEQVPVVSNDPGDKMQVHKWITAEVQFKHPIQDFNLSPSTDEAAQVTSHGGAQTLRALRFLPLPMSSPFLNTDPD